MGLVDRIADLVAKLFSPTMDHPSRGGMTGGESGPDGDGTDEGSGPEADQADERPAPEETGGTEDA